MKKTAVIVTVLLVASLLSGCGKGGAYDYGEEIFSCNPDNMLGFEGLYLDDGRMTMLFDEDYVFDEDYPEGVSGIFERERFNSRNAVFFTCGDERVTVNGEDIEINAEEMTFSFDVEDLDWDDLSAFSISVGTPYHFNISDGIMTADCTGGECIEHYSQVYDASSDSWSELECELQLCPETVVDEPAEPGDAPASAVIQIDYVPADYGRILPCVAEYYEDAYTPENNTCVFRLINLDGEEVCGPYFDMSEYCAGADAYILRRTSQGLTKYGVLSADGSLFTELKYDGLWSVSPEEACGVSFYATEYQNGTLHVVSLNAELETVDECDITIDPDQLPYTASGAQLSVCYLNGNRAIIVNRSAFYYHKILIDTETGDVLYDDNAAGDIKTFVFGDVIIEQGIGGDGVTVYNLDGEVIVSDNAAYGSIVTPYRYLLASDDEICVYDIDWEVVNSVPGGFGMDVFSSFGHIAICEDGNTTIYDQDLQFVCDAGNVDLSDGSYLRDWYDYGEGDMYFRSYEDDGYIINLNTGDTLACEDGLFSYTFTCGYLFSDNLSDGNNPDNLWRVYDGSLNLILSGEGYEYEVIDEITGELYFVYIDDGVMNVCSLPDGDVIFRSDEVFYNLTAVDGCFCGWNEETFMLYDGDGSLIAEYTVDYTEGSF